MQVFFIPKKCKYRKLFRGRLRYKNVNNVSLTKGSLGIQVLEDSRISTEQMESVRRYVRRFIKRKGKLFFIRKANLSLTAKPAEVRMGSGKGSPSTWALRLNKGLIIAELRGVPFFKAYKALTKSLTKLSVKSRIIFF